MKIRAWLIVGDAAASRQLQPHMETARPLTSTVSRVPHNTLPAADAHQPGEWLIWHSGGYSYTVVCWEISGD